VTWDVTLGGDMGGDMGSEEKNEVGAVVDRGDDIEVTGPSELVKGQPKSVEGQLESV
jgi:hypothetical protein